MNLSREDKYLEFFYGPQSHWYALTLSTMSSFIVLSNAFLIVLTLTSKPLRSNSSNWFLVGFAFTDLLNGSAHMFNGIAIWNGSIENRHLCSLAGTFVVFTAACGYGFPFLIAADRYYKVTTLERRKYSLGVFFSERFTIPLIISWYCISALCNLPLLLSNAFGEDPGGFCGARKFTEVSMLLMYETSVISVFGLSLVLSGIFYLRLAKWLKEHKKTSSNTAKGRNYTEEVMRFTKIIMIIPLVFATPAAFLSGGQMLLPEIPIWLHRAITLPYFLSCIVNPWLTMVLIRPFRQRLRQFLRKDQVYSSRVIPSNVVAANMIVTRRNKPVFVTNLDPEMSQRRFSRI